MSTLLRVCCASIPYAASPLAWIHGFHSSQALASIQTSNPTIGISLPLSLPLSQEFAVYFGRTNQKINYDWSSLLVYRGLFYCVLCVILLYSCDSVIF